MAAPALPTMSRPADSPTGATSWLGYGMPSTIGLRRGLKAVRDGSHESLSPSPQAVQPHRRRRRKPAPAAVRHASISSTSSVQRGESPSRWHRDAGGGGSGRAGAGAGAGAGGRSRRPHLGAGASTSSLRTSASSPVLHPLPRRDSSPHRTSPSGDDLQCLTGLRFMLGGHLPDTAIPSRFHTFDSAPAYGDAAATYNASTGRMQDAVFLTHVFEQLLAEAGSSGVEPHASPAGASPVRVADSHLHKVGMGLLDIVTHGRASSHAGTSASVVAKSTPARPRFHMGGPPPPPGDTTPPGPQPLPPPPALMSPIIVSHEHTANADRAAPAAPPDPAAFVKHMLTLRLTADLPVYELVLYELVRQVFVACEERGVLLERVRQRYLAAREQFDEAWSSIATTCQSIVAQYRTMQAAVAAADARAASAEQRAAAADAAAASLRDDMAKLRADAEAKAEAAEAAAREREQGLRDDVTAAAARYAALQEQLADARAHVAELQDALAMEQQRRDERALQSRPGSRAAALRVDTKGGAAGRQATTGSQVTPTHFAASSGSARSRAMLSPGSPSKRSMRVPSALSRRAGGAASAGSRRSATSARSSRSAHSAKSQRNADSGDGDGGGDDAAHGASDADTDSDGDAETFADGEARRGRGGRGDDQHDDGGGGGGGDGDGDDGGGGSDSDGGGGGGGRRKGRTAGGSRRSRAGNRRRASSRSQRLRPGRKRAGGGHGSDTDGDGDDHDAGSLMLDNRELQRRRLGQLLVPEPLTKLQKLHRFRQRFRVPLSWKSFLGLSAEEGLRRDAGRVAVLSKLQALHWQLLVEKVRSDAGNTREGLPCDEMPEFVTNHLLYNFGARALVQDRLNDFILSIEEHALQDRLSFMMARFCKLVDAVPLTAVSVVLKALLMAFDNKLPAAPMTSVTKAFTISVSLHKALRAVQHVASALQHANWRRAQERLIGYFYFGAESPDRSLDALDQWMTTAAAAEAMGAAPPTASAVVPTASLTATTAPPPPVTSPTSSPSSPKPVASLDQPRQARRKSHVARHSLTSGGSAADVGAWDDAHGGVATPLTGALAMNRHAAQRAATAARSVVTASLADVVPSDGSDGDGDDEADADADADAGAGEDHGTPDAAGSSAADPSIPVADGGTVEAAVPAPPVPAVPATPAVAPPPTASRRRRMPATATVDVVDMMEVVLEMWRDSVDNIRAHLANLFKECDTNDNGVLELEEFQLVLQQFANSFQRARQDSVDSTGGGADASAGSGSGGHAGDTRRGGDSHEPSASPPPAVALEQTSRRLYFECIKRTASGDITVDVFVDVVEGYLAAALQKEFAVNQEFLESLVTADS